MPATVAIVGRPNVGKSTLFNRLTRRRRALTHDLPGVTRDRVAADAPRPSGGSVVLVDTGGFEPDSEAQIPRMIRDQALRAIAEADAVVLVVDGSQGLVPSDREIADSVRRTGTPVVLAVNKADRRDADFGDADFLGLGFPMVMLSAEHGRGIGELWEALEPLLPAPDEEEAAEQPPELAVAIVGRPNVGKSSLANRLLGDERVLVSEVPGTTRDVVDTLLEVRGRAVRLLDTAGIRRKGRTDRGPEVLSVVVARKAIERAHICLVVLDAVDGVTAQDAHVAGYVNEAGRGVVVVVNKADLLERADARAQREAAERVLDKLKFLRDTPVVFTSALTGAGVEKVLVRALEVGDAFAVKVSTGELNRVLRSAWERHPPPGGKRPVRLFYATQVASRPPRFTLFTSAKGELHFSYVRYLENSLREAFSLAGVPIRFMMRGQHGRSG